MKYTGSSLQHVYRGHPSSGHINPVAPFHEGGNLPFFARYRGGTDLPRMRCTASWWWKGGGIEVVAPLLPRRTTE